MTALWQDIRYGFRQLLKNPGFTVVAVLTLALGISLNSAIFSVAYGVLWRPLPYPNPDRLVIVASSQQTEAGVKTFWTWAPLTYEALRPRVTTLDHLAAYASIDTHFTGRGEPLQLHALDVSPNFFATLGVNPTRGRAFLTTGAAATDDDRTVIVSDRLWRASLKADPAVVGQSITIDGFPRTVIGVLPPDFSFRSVVRIGALPEADIFLPNRWPGDTGRDAFLFLLGRMKAGVTQERAEAELTAMVNDSSIAPAGALAPEGALAPNVRTLSRVVGLQEYGTDSVRTLLLIVLGAVSFVLLIACVNVANLQMARLTARRGELFVRMALGAGRRRIVRQLLTEAVVLSLLGVVADIRQMGLDRSVQPMIYVPFQQDSSGFLRFVSFVARTLTPAGVAEGILAEIRRVAPDLPIESAVTMDEAVGASVVQPRFRMLLLVLFATTATLIATCGIYGLMAYAVTQRRREIGVRMALGAQRRNVLALVVGQGMKLAVIGVMIGLLGAFALVRVLTNLLFEVKPLDLLTFAVVSLLLFTVAAIACWFPARRAVRIDPMAALRCE